MNITTPIIAFILMCSVFVSSAQTQFKNVFELNVDYGITNDYGEGKTYDTRNFGEIINVEQRSTTRKRNYQVGFARYLNVNHGIKTSFGLSTFGFNVLGRTDPTFERVNTSYSITLLEWGLSYIRRINLTEEVRLLIEPGLRFHSDGSTNSPIIRISRKDAFAFSLYSGIETPMLGDQLFATLGIQAKIPLEAYSSSFRPTNYYPYFIGIKVGLNFQFNFW